MSERQHQYRNPPVVNNLIEWFSTAKWWQFWNPGSGLIGGAIWGVLIQLVYVVVISCWRII